MKKVLKKYKYLIAILLIGVIVGVYFLLRPKNDSALMREVSVNRGNITTYNSFVGNVSASSDMNVISLASEKVTGVSVEKGDIVKKGDIIANLNTENIEYNISLRKAGLDLTKTNNYYTIEDVKRNYENFKEVIDEGLYTSLNSAERAMDTAYDAYSEASKAYRDAKKSIDTDHSFKVSGTDIIKPLYDFMTNAKLALDEEKAKESPTDLDQLEKNYTDAKKLYDDTRTKILDGYEKALSQTESYYDTAKESYDYVVLSINQQLDTFEYNLDKVKALTSTKTSDMELKKLQETLEDYTITAPCDGVITGLYISEGDMVGAGSPVAVISNLDTMKISIKVDEYSVINTKVGSNVKIYIDSIQKTYDGTITWIADVATIAGGVSFYEATVNFTSDDDVRSGMSVEVRLTKNDVHDVLIVPVDAINYRDNNEAYVNVKDAKGNLIEKDVTLGVSDGTNVEVLTGLEENEKVYYTPNLFDINDMMMYGG